MVLELAGKVPDWLLSKLTTSRGRRSYGTDGEQEDFCLLTSQKQGFYKLGKIIVFSKKQKWIVLGLEELYYVIYLHIQLSCTTGSQLNQRMLTGIIISVKCL